MNKSRKIEKSTVEKLSKIVGIPGFRYNTQAGHSAYVDIYLSRQLIG